MMTAHRRFLFLVQAGVLACGIGFAPATHAESVTDAVIAALNHHPSIEAAVAGRNAVAQDGRESTADYFPHLNVNAGGGRGYMDNSTSRGLSVTRDAGYTWIWEGGVTLSQPLFRGFETVNRVSAADARVQSADYNILDVRENLGLRAVLAYIDVLRTRESVAALQRQAQTLQSYIGRIQGMVAEGGGDQAMVVQASDIKAQFDATLASAEGQLRAAVATYEEVTGRLPPEGLVKPVPALDIIPEDVQQGVSYAKAHHPLLKSALYTQESLAYDVDAERGGYYPDITGEMSYYKKDQDDIVGGEVLDAKAMVRMSWDYSIGGAQQARVRRSLYNQAESQAKHKDMERQVAHAIEVSYSEMKTAYDLAMINRERLALNHDLLKTQRTQFEGGKVNLLQLLQTENALFNAHFTLLNGDYRLLGAQYAVLASIGRLQESLNVAPVREASLVTHGQ